MIEGNKDEAMKCIEIAQIAFTMRDYEKSEKFLLKAEKLYPTTLAKEMLGRARAASTTRSRKAPSSGVEELKRPSTPPEPPLPPQHKYTKEEVDAVNRVNIKGKDYYEILGVSKDASENEIKKSYKRLALQLHPDKNHAPGAAEAFKAIGNAAGVLTNPDKRKQYDLRGEEIQVPQAHEQYYTTSFTSDITAEEMFNIFFGTTGQPVYRRRFAREPERRDTRGGFAQLLPVLVLVLLSMMSGLFISEPVFSLTISSKYPVSRETVNLKVPYYVKENFHTEYQGSLRRLESAIEDEFILNLRHACQREKNYRENLISKARTFGDPRQYQDAQRMRTPSCEKLQTLHR